MIRALYILILLALMVSCFSCTRHVSKSRNKSEIKEEKVTKVNEEDKIKSELTTEAVTAYGDTLNTSLYFEDKKKDTSFSLNDTITVDSAESAGIKVKGTLVKTRYGEKLNLTAIAKPVYKTDKTTLKTEQNKDTKGFQSIKADSTQTNKEVQKETTGIAFGYLWFIPVILLLLAAYMAYRYYKWHFL